MNLKRWNKLYENNKRLDYIFIDKYKDDNKLFQKNCIELMVEIGEFINETKIFKYWSIKKPNKDKMLEEYADVITITLTFFREHNLKIEETKKETNEDILDIICKLYLKSCEFYQKNDTKTLKEIFNYILIIGRLLEFRENEVLDKIEEKQKIIEERLNSDY